MAFWSYGGKTLGGRIPPPPPGLDRIKRSIKELSQFDNKKPEELESEFDHCDAANSYPTSPFKGRNLVDLDFVYKQLLDGHKPYTPL